MTKSAEYSYWSTDRLHAVIQPVSGVNTAFYAHEGGLGNTIALTDAAGSFTARTYQYDDWGRLTGGTNFSLPVTDKDRAWWKGALWLGPETDSYFMRNRWYEPATGRFLSEDPIGLAGGINPLVFANPDPVNARDPSGLCYNVYYDKRTYDVLAVVFLYPGECDGTGRSNTYTTTPFSVSGNYIGPADPTKDRTPPAKVNVPQCVAGLGATALSAGLDVSGAREVAGLFKTAGALFTAGSRALAGASVRGAVADATRAVHRAAVEVGEGAFESGWVQTPTTIVTGTVFGDLNLKSLAANSCRSLEPPSVRKPLSRPVGFETKAHEREHPASIDKEPWVGPRRRPVLRRHVFAAREPGLRTRWRSVD